MYEVRPSAVRPIAAVAIASIAVLAVVVWWKPPAGAAHLADAVLTRLAAFMLFGSAILLTLWLLDRRKQ
jgi:hypothetical protein